MKRAEISVIWTFCGANLLSSLSPGFQNAQFGRRPGRHDSLGVRAGFLQTDRCRLQMVLTESYTSK